MKNNTIKICLISALTILGTAAPAMSQSVPFTALVGQSSSCTIVIQRNGTLAPNTANTVLSSKNNGGESGLALVTPFNGRYGVSANSYNVWNTAPVDLSAVNTNFAASHLGRYRGNLLWGERNTPIRLRAFLNSLPVEVEVELAVNKTDGSTFPQGNYRTDVGILCE